MLFEFCMVGLVGRFCCQARPEPRPDAARRQGLEIRRCQPLSGDGNLGVVVIGNYSVWSDDGGTMPSAGDAFTARVDPVSPPSRTAFRPSLVEAPGTAPGSTAFILRRRLAL